MKLRQTNQQEKKSRRSALRLLQSSKSSKLRVQSSLTNHIRLVLQSQKHIEDVMEKLELDIDVEDGNRQQVLGKPKLALYNKRFDQLRPLLRPELQDLHRDQQQYETNLAEAKTHEAEYKEQLSKYDNQILALQTKLYGLNRWHCRELVNGKDCGEPHSSYLHGTSVALDF